jgi:hypothetical protein
VFAWPRYRGEVTRLATKTVTMTLQAKLILAFSMVASVPLVGGAIGIYSHRVAVRQKELARQTAREASQLVSAAHAVQLAIEAARHERAAAADVHAAAIRDNLAQIASLAAAFSIRPELLTAVAAPPETGGTSAATPPGAAGADRAAAAQALLAEVVQRSYAALHADQAESTEDRYLDLIMGGGTLFGIALGIGFGVVTSVAVTRHIRGIAQHMWSQTTGVAAAAHQVAGTSGDLARASSQQADSLEATSAALIAVNRIVKTNVGQAREAQSIARENRQASDCSATDVADLQTAMQEMATASANIAKIIKSIDEIAFQTNILALNAAVEAARAGEAGAGFAVVAGEVGNLAQRSAQAARETTEKIDDALAKSRRGAEIAARVEQSLRKVIGDTHRVDEIIARIAAASEEQAKGLDQAVDAMSHIDQLTKDNTASAEQTAATARQLDAKSDELRQQLSRLMDQRVEQPAALPTAEAPRVSRSRAPLPRALVEV